MITLPNFVQGLSNKEKKFLGDLPLFGTINLHSDQFFQISATLDVVVKLWLWQNHYWGFRFLHLLARPVIFVLHNLAVQVQVPRDCSFVFVTDVDVYYRIRQWGLGIFKWQYQVQTTACCMVMKKHKKYSGPFSVWRLLNRVIVCREIDVSHGVAHSHEWAKEIPRSEQTGIMFDADHHLAHGMPAPIFIRK